MKPPAVAELQVRTRVLGTFGEVLPADAAPLFELAVERDWPSLSFAVPALSPSVNKMYKQVSYDRRVLSPETVTYRHMVALAIGSRRHDWRPRGPVMAMVFLLQPFWLTKKSTMRDVDGDNRLKALFDAIQLATGVPDYTNWTLHTYKITTTQRVATIVYLYDTGDIVDVFR